MTAAPGGGRAAPPSALRRNFQSLSAESKPLASPEAKETTQGKADDDLHITGLSVSGALSESAVKNFVDDQLKTVRDCYPKGRAEMTMEITLAWTIEANGRVSSLTVINKGKDTGALERCLKELAKRWRFPAAAGTSQVTLSVTRHQG
jgi:TonB family protein